MIQATRCVLRSLFAAAKKLARKPRTDIAGYVERIDPSVIIGWAFSRSGKPLDLAVRVNGHEYAQDPAWTERLDVAASAGATTLKSGFQIRPTAALKSVLSQEGLEDRTIDILANGHVLPKIERAFRPQHLASEALAIGTETETHQAAIESWRPFIIRGWVVARDAAHVSIDVTVSGKPLQCSVVRSGRQDVEAALGAACPEAGFEIELPGYLWELAGDTGSCAITLLADGRSITPEPLVLTQEKVVQWIRKIAGLGEGQQRQYFGLLALEHLRYGVFFRNLDDETKRFVRTFARQMRLEDFVFTNIEDRVKEADTPTEDPSSLLLEAAMRELNSTLENTGSEKYEAVRTVLKNHDLRGPAKEWYLNLAVQITCASGEFMRLRESMDLGHLYQFEASSQPRQLSLLLPVLVDEMQILRAADVVRRLSKHLDRDWVHTECVLYALQRVQRLETDGEIDLDAAEKFRDAFFGLLDGFKSEWFSRLHDRDLVDAMIAVVIDLERYNDYHKRNVVAAAIRHYGLCPTFWQRLGARLLTLPDDELCRAGAAWRNLHDALERHAIPISGRLEELVESVAYFYRRGNPEATIFLRELVANSLPDLNRTLSPAAYALIETLLASDPAEALRISAFPLVGENALQARFPEMGDRLFHTLRQLNEHLTSVVYDLQCTAATALRSAQAAVRSGDAAALKETLGEVERKAIDLADRPSMYLGADLLASVYVLAAESEISTGALLMRLGEMVRSAIRDSKAEKYLPSPICSALARLAGLPGDADLRRFMGEMQAVIRDKFELRHDALFAPIAARALTVANSGWPRDTLVAIYSCRKHLDTRIQAIRETWLQDLKARGISFVVVVGDGDDTLRGDVLALDVSDHYEDMPRKTLKLFDWVSRHTDAQYLLKIDDDCYLDVARYFDTLSYRKYPYYGRVIHRDAGGMDRALHQQQSYTLHGQKTLDKSPEPSVYADGEAAYCLSRLAILKMQEAAATEAGRRLIGRSFKEDKLVGDLLALCHILPSDEDFESHQLRRTFREAMPVAMFENTFFPARLTPTKVVHLDSGKDFAATREKTFENTIWPKKIWPTCSKPGIRANSNQLELLTEPGKAEALLREILVVVAVVRNEMVMLPHFLAHYRQLGVKCFVFVDNCSDDGTREYLLSQPDAVVYSADTEYRCSHYGVAWQQAVMGNLFLGKWVLLADADEFIVYENCETIPLADLVRSIEMENRDGALLYMIDMYPYGDLGDACFEKGKPFELAPYFDKDALIELRFGGGSYSNSRNFVNGLRHRIAPSRINAYVSQKYALFRYQPWIRLAEGVHYSANMAVTTKPVFFAHFKYHAGFKNKVLTEVKRNQHFNGAEEYRRYVSMLAEGMGGFGAEGLTAHYRNSTSFLELMERKV